MDQSKTSGLPVVHKWEKWINVQPSEHVRSQIQFSSHWRRRVSVRGRLGEWLHQYFGVRCSPLAFSPLGLSTWVKCPVCSLFAPLRVTLVHAFRS